MIIQRSDGILTDQKSTNLLSAAACVSLQGVQLTSAHLNMSTNDPVDQSDDTLDTTDVALSCSDGQDPILLMRDALDADRRKKPTCTQLWAMVNHLYDSSNRTAAENAALRKDCLTLKAENANLHLSSAELREKLLDLQDEFQAYKQKTTADLQSINPTKSTSPPRHSRNTVSNNVLSFLQDKTKPSTSHSSSTVVSGSPVKPPAENMTNLNSSTTTGITSGQQGDTWATVASRKKVVRGSQLVNLDSQSSLDETILTLSTIKREPHMDFNVQGVPRLEDTLFQSIEEYNEHYKAALIKDGFKVRFVSVYRPSDNKRGSTSLRIGSFVSEKEKLMDTAKWPSNCRICLWDYNLPAKKTSHQLHSPKNRV